MSKKALLITISGLFCSLIFISTSYGPAAGYDGNLTGSTGSTATCNTGSSCHGGSVSSTTSVSLSFCDSGTTTSRTTYEPNKVYTIHLSGSNSLSKARFGFQCSSTNSSGGQAGRFRAVASYTDTIRNSSTGSIQVVEQSSAIAGSSGSYSTYFNWKAPASGTGTVGFYCILNAVNYNFSADTGDKYNYGSTLSISEATATNISEFGTNYVFSVYPNPVTTQAYVQVKNANNGVYTINIFDQAGKKVLSENADVNTFDYQIPIKTSNWAAGMYIVSIEKNGANHLIKIIKQ